MNYLWRRSNDDNNYLRITATKKNILSNVSSSIFEIEIKRKYILENRFIFLPSIHPSKKKEKRREEINNL